MSGLATDEALHTYSERAIDFGSVAPGAVSEPREVTMLTQRTPESVQLEFVGAFSNPAEVFELVSAPSSPQQFVSCVPLQLEIRFVAPQEPGPVEGSLLWRNSWRDNS